MSIPRVTARTPSFIAGAALLPLAFVVSTASTGAAAATEQAENRVIEEIVVSSRRRAESAQDIPISVSAFRAEDIERIAPQTLRDFDGLMPNVFIGMNTAGPSAGAVYVRGVGYADIEKTQSPAVGVVIDGVYQGSSTGQLIDAFDIEQIEVNRGPQGVLFGKNTTGGTIVVNRTRPTGEFGLRASAELGDYEGSVVKLIGNAPVVDDVLAAKVGFTRRSRDGFYDNITQGDDAGAIDFRAWTGALLFTPNERFEALLTVDRIEDEGDIPPQDPRFNGDDVLINEADAEEYQIYNVNAIGLQMSFDAGFGTIRSITGWNQADDSVFQDFDGAALTSANIPLVRLHTFRDQTYDTFTQELRLEMQPTEDVDLTLGGYYFASELEFTQDSEQIVQLPNEAVFGGAFSPGCVVVPGVLAFTPNPNPAIGDTLCQLPTSNSFQAATEDVDSVALFAAANWRVTEQIELSAGVRWIDEEKDFSNAFFDVTTGMQVPGVALTDDDSWDDVIVEGSATWQFRPTNNVYVRYAEGFRSGGFSIRGTGTGVCSATVCDAGDAAVIGTTIDVVGPSVLGPGGVEIAAPPDGVPDFIVSTPVSFEPEEAWSVEIGSKNEFLDNRLRVNLAAFYTEIEGQQFSTIVQTPSVLPSTNTIINNGSKREIQGLEAEVIAVFSDHFQLIVNGGLQESESDPVFLDGARSNRGPGSTVLRAGTALPEPGQDFGLRTPEYNWSVTGVYERRFGPGLMTLNVSYRGQDEFVIGVNAGLPIYEDGYELLDASLSYLLPRDDGRTFRFFLTGKNLTDEEYKEQVLTLGSINSGFQGWGAPRYVAVGFEVEL